MRIRDGRIKRSSKGFTLIELLVVIAIIGILATIALVSLNGARQKAKNTKALSTAKQVATIAEMCLIDGKILSGLSSDSSNPGTAICDGGTDIYPDLSGTGFFYRSDPFITNLSKFGFIVQTSDGGTGPVIICGSGVNLGGWFGFGSDFDFTGSSGCRTKNF